MAKIKSKDIYLVTIQGILFVVYLFWNPWEIEWPMFWIHLAGIILGTMGLIIILVSILQLSENLSPFPTPKTNSQLVTTGLYKFVRHPIYSGIILAMVGYGLFSSSVSRLIVAIITYIFFYIKSEYEEKLLSQKFPRYTAYKERTGRIWPKL